MEKVRIKDLIEFRQKSERSRHTHIINLKKEKPPKTDDKGGGGDYWVSCLSALSNVYHTDDTDLINQKIEMLQNKIPITTDKKTKDRWQKNIDLLYNFGDYDFKSIKPNDDLTFLKKHDFQSIIKIDGLPIQSKPHHVFSYTNNDFEEVGAVWFIAQKDGYQKSELGMFCDIMYRYLIAHYSDKYKVNPAFCIAIDVFNCQDVNYSQLLNGEIAYLLDSTVIDVKKFL